MLAEAHLLQDFGRNVPLDGLKPAVLDLLA